MDSEDQFLEELTKPLVAKLNVFVAMGRAFNRQTLHDIDELVRDHATALQRRGVKFPQLVALVLPSVRAIHLCRADMEHKGLQQTILNLATMYPRIDAREIAEAVRDAFPGYAPRVHVDGTEYVELSEKVLDLKARRLRMAHQSAPH